MADFTVETFETSLANRNYLPNCFSDSFDGILLFVKSGVKFSSLDTYTLGTKLKQRWQ